MTAGPIAVLGPTGAGKTDFALRLATALPVEIISVDSAQVYRGLDIGTAKPLLAERSRVEHHLIDIRDPEAVYSAGEFRTIASRCLRRSRRGAAPLLGANDAVYLHCFEASPAAGANAEVRDNRRA